MNCHCMFIVDFVMCDWMYSQSPSPGAVYLDTMLRLCFFSQIIFSAFLSHWFVATFSFPVHVWSTAYFLFNSPAALHCA